MGRGAQPMVALRRSPWLESVDKLPAASVERIEPNNCSLVEVDDAKCTGLFPDRVLLE